MPPLQFKRKPSLRTRPIATRPKQWRSFREARAFARKLKLKTRAEWVAYCKGQMPRLGRLPGDVPARADIAYADKGWKGVGDWLGTGAVAPRLRQFRPFREARAFARRLKLKNHAEWVVYYKGQMPRLGRRPADIPAAPWRTYAHKGWKSFGDWLGTNNVAYRLKAYRPFREARAFARHLGLRSQHEWVAFCKGEMPRLGSRPADIPAAPQYVYADKGWKGTRDWLGTGNTPRTWSAKK